MEAINIVPYVRTGGTTEWQVWRSDIRIAIFDSEADALHYQSFLCSNLHANYTALEAENTALKEERDLLNDESYYLREQLHLTTASQDVAPCRECRAQGGARRSATAGAGTGGAAVMIILDLVRFMWHRDSESAEFLIIDLSFYLSPQNLNEMAGYFNVLCAKERSRERLLR